MNGLPSRCSAATRHFASTPADGILSGLTSPSLALWTSDSTNSRKSLVVNSTSVRTLLSGGERATRKDQLYRALDVSGAALAILFTLPLIAFLSLLIVCESPGPVLVRHRRVRPDGSQHYLVKFRTERPGANTRHEKTLANDRAERAVSKLGAVFRTIGFDEIPILISVFKGDLPICGHYTWRQVMAWLSTPRAQDQ